MVISRTFDPRLKLDVRNGYIPDEFQGMVSYHQIYHWKRENWNKYIGYKYYNKRDENLRHLNREVVELKKRINKLNAENEALRLVCKTCTNDAKITHVLFENKSAIVECIEKNKKVFKIKEFCKSINITQATYCSWKNKIKAKCKLTKNLVCAKKRINTLTDDEEAKIIKMLKDSKYQHYSINTIMLIAKYENIVHASREVWNRIRKENNIELNIAKKNPKIKRKDKGLKAEYVNQYLHADVTAFKPYNRKTFWIYIVRDNYSRYIKSWMVSTRISAKARLLTFKRALEDIKEGRDLKVSFVTDAGTENTAHIIEDYLKTKKNVNLLLARKDIPFSNNMVERFFRELKYRYLYKDDVKTYQELKRKVDQAVYEHNHVQRFRHLQGQTPFEVYNAIPNKTEWVSEQVRLAMQNRRNAAYRIICCFGEPILIKNKR